MNIILSSLIDVILILAESLKWILILSTALSWLIAFGVLNTQNRFIYTLHDILYRITEPFLRPIRRLLPSQLGVDFSPLILILILIFTQSVLSKVYLKML